MRFSPITTLFPSIIPLLISIICVILGLSLFTISLDSEGGAERSGEMEWGLEEEGTRAGEGNETEIPPIEMGELVIENATRNLTDSRLLFNGNITIGNGGILNLENSTLMLNSTNVTRFSIIVEEGGILNMTGSTIQNVTFWGYGFLVRGTLNMDNCTVYGMYHPLEYEQSGIIIRSDGVILNGSTIRNSGFESRALFINNSSPIIRNCNLSADYYGAYLVNGSYPRFTNTTFITNIGVGKGVLCNGSSFLFEDCNLTGNTYALDIESGIKGEVLNTTFHANWIGVVLTEFVDMNPLFRECTFQDSELSAMFLYSNATIDGCTFIRNVIPGQYRPIAPLVMRGLENETLFVLTNTTFQDNHNGILIGDGMFVLNNCTLLNNTRFAGHSGISLYGPMNNYSFTMSDSTIRGHPTGMEIVNTNHASIIDISRNIFRENEVAIRLWNSTPAIQNNTFIENECSIEERYFQGPGIRNNGYVNNEVNSRYIIRVDFLIQDGYGINLTGATVNLTANETPEPYDLEFETVGAGRIVVDIKWEETTTRTYSFHPYTVRVNYQGIEITSLLEDEDSDRHVIVVPYLRPNLTLEKLEIENLGFSLLEDRTRENEQSFIRFVVRNVGEGKATNATVIVNVGTRTLTTKLVTLDPGEKKDFKIRWTPDYEGKINISVEVSVPNELNVTENSLFTWIDVGEDQRGYYYLSVLLTVLMISALIWWMAGNIEGADEDMAEFSRKTKKWLSGLFESWAKKLSTEENESYEDSPIPIPAGDIYSWDGEVTMSGSGKCNPWSLEDENLLKERKKDVMTVQIKIPLPEPEIVEEIPEMEVFEWITSKGEKESIQVDKRTITKISHPKMYICSLCDRNFVSAAKAAKCPWCSGKAYFIQDM